MRGRETSRDKGRRGKAWTLLSPELPVDEPRVEDLGLGGAVLVLGQLLAAQERLELPADCSQRLLVHTIVPCEDADEELGLSQRLVKVRARAGVGAYLRTDSE